MGLGDPLNDALSLMGSTDGGREVREGVRERLSVDVRKSSGSERIGGGREVIVEMGQGGREGQISNAIT